VLGAGCWGLKVINVLKVLKVKGLMLDE